MNLGIVVTDGSQVKLMGSRSVFMLVVDTVRAWHKGGTRSSTCLSCAFAGFKYLLVLRICRL